MTTLTLGEFKYILSYLIDNNHRLIDNGDTPISVCIEGDAGLGKALKNGTKVLSEKGFVPIETLNISDRVYNSCGELCDILGVFPQKGKHEVYNVHFDDGTIISCNKDHIWTIWKYKYYNKNKKIGVKKGRVPIDMTTQELFDLDQNNMLTRPHVRIKNNFKYISKRYLTVNLPKPINYSENKSLELDPYSLGVLLGDGCLYDKKGHITMTVSEKKKELFLNKLSIEGIEYKIYHDSHNNPLISFVNTDKNRLNHLSQKLKRIGLFPVHSYEKFIPKEYLTSSVEQRMNLLQGLLDTDGHNNYKKHFEYSTSSKQLANDVVELCRSLGLYCTITERIPSYIYNGERRKGRLNYRIFVNFNKKYKRIISVEKTNEESEMTCIMVNASDHLYITEGYTLTHNTAAVEQVAKERDMQFRKVNLAQIEEPAELVGFPYKEYKITQNGTEKWIAADLLRDMNCDFLATGESRMSYAVPAWVPRDENPNGTMLVLDDFSRANSLILQAVMEIINTGSYISWSLPKYTSIVLTSNPDNGQYNINSLDSAMLSRLITFHGKFSIQEWARWAEMFGIDGRAINFAMLYNTEIFEPKNNVVVANARSYTTFCRAIGGIENWNDDKSLAIIYNIASGCFLEKDNIIGNLFTQFINNKLDKLIQPDKMINGNWDIVSTEIYACVHNNNVYRADIANILGTRFLNYCDKHLGTSTVDANKVGERIEAFFCSDKELFTQDILYHIVKTLCKNHVRHTNKWFLNKHIREIAL